MWSISDNRLNPNPITKFFVVGLLGFTVLHSIDHYFEWAIIAVISTMYFLNGLKKEGIEPTAEGFYVVEIDFPKGIDTNYGKTLPIICQMLGSADIITEDLRLIERLLMPIKKLLKNQQ